MSVAALVKKYEAMSLRERALVVLAALALLVMVWNTILMEPLRRARGALESELASASTFGANADGSDVSDPRQVSIRQAGELQTRLAYLDAQLNNQASGFVAADRMIDVLHDVLEAQGRLELVSIRNLPVVSLVPAAQEDASADGSGSTSTSTDSAEVAAAAAEGAAVQAPQPPFMHGVEIVIDGEYSDIVEYLAALEALPWKLRWSTLDLSTTGYPRNRVRIVLSTLSLDATWLGV